MKVHIYRDAAGDLRWHLKAKNGKIIADSGQGYKTKRALVNALDIMYSNQAGNAFHEAEKALRYEKQIISAYDNLKAKPSSALTLEQLREALVKRGFV